MPPHPDYDALRGIEAELAADDPKLASKLTMSTRIHSWRAVLAVAELTAILMIVVGIFATVASMFFLGVLSTTLLIWLHRAIRIRSKSRLFAGGPHG